jgi:hypothetical protein
MGQIRAVSIADAFVEHERLGILDPYMQSLGLSDRLLDSAAPGTGRVVELLNTCVTLVGWPLGPFRWAVYALAVDTRWPFIVDAPF